MIFSAVPPGSTVRALDLPRASEVGIHQAVVGVAITGEKPGAVFVNLGAESVVVQLPDELSGKWAVTAATAPPDAQPGWVATDEVTTTRTTTERTLQLPAYSVVGIVRA